MRAEPPPIPEIPGIPEIPVGTLRLFAHYDPADLAPDSGRPSSLPFLIGRLLEDGDRDDLAWLAASCPEPILATWLAEHGTRQLSARSRAYWHAVLGPLPAGDARAEGPGPSGGASLARRAKVSVGGAPRDLTPQPDLGLPAAPDLWPL